MISTRNGRRRCARFSPSPAFVWRIWCKNQRGRPRRHDIEEDTCMTTKRCCFATILLIVLVAAHAAGGEHRRRVIIDQDAFGPAGSNLQAILMLLQATDVDVLGITITSGDGWRDEEVDHTLRLLEIAGRPEVPVLPGAVLPLVNSFARTRAWESLYGKLYYKGAWTESWPDQGVVRRIPHPTDPYLVPPSPAGTPRIKATAGSAAEFLVREGRRPPGQA